MTRFERKAASASYLAKLAFELEFDSVSRFFQTRERYFNLRNEGLSPWASWQQRHGETPESTHDLA